MKKSLRFYRDAFLQFIFVLFGLVYWAIILAIFFVGKIFHKQKKSASKQRLTSYAKVSGSFQNWGVNFNYKKLEQHIKPGDKVIDIGAGKGYLLKRIQSEKNADVKGIDVADYGQVDIPITIFDGVSIPFPDNSFDVGILGFVLHHTKKQTELLQEVKRTCRKVIIFEDDLIGRIGKLIGKGHSLAYGRIYKINSTCYFHSPEEWQEMFQGMGLRVEKYSQSWKPDCLFYPVKMSIFVLNSE
jgi:SAM-dependent methyltransferase